MPVTYCRCINASQLLQCDRLITAITIATDTCQIRVSNCHSYLFSQWPCHHYHERHLATDTCQICVSNCHTYLSSQWPSNHGRHNLQATDTCEIRISNCHSYLSSQWPSNHCHDSPLATDNCQICISKCIIKIFITKAEVFKLLIRNVFPHRQYAVMLKTCALGDTGYTQ